MLWLPLILIIPYLCLLFRIWLGLKKITPYVPSTLTEIKISVIIACRNEKDNLPLLLADISNQNFPAANLEIIVVDDNSSDNTTEFAEAAVMPFRKIVIKNKGAGKKMALMSGIEVSTGELIVTTDADCRAGTNWINTISSFYSDNLPHIIICPVIFSDGSGIFASLQQLEFMSLQGITAGAALNGEPVMCNGANLAFTRQTYDDNKANLHFGIESGDDMFLLLSHKKKEGSLIKWLESRDACIITRQAENPASFFRQRSRWFSKWPLYKDYNILLLSGVTFFTNASIAAAIICGFINTSFFVTSAMLLVLKSVPDILILSDVALRYRKKNTLMYFLPAQLLYPFYVIIVALVSVLSKPVWKKY